MFIGLGLRIALLGSAAFWPSELFINGEPGQLMPVDPAYLYQDTAGTTPVTATGQSVALQLDQSKGLVLGPELVTNGDFSAGSTGWTLGTGWSISSGVASANTTTGAEILQSTSQWAGQNGKTYLVTATVTMIATPNAAASVAINIGGLGEDIPVSTQNNLQAGVTYQIRKYAKPTTASTFLIRVGSGYGLNYPLNYTIDNISVRELPGNHDTQPTVGSRPIYGKHPANGYRNMLASSEDFSAAVWVKTSVTVAANATVAPDGTTTADKVIQSAALGAHYVSQTVSGTSPSTRTLYAKNAGYNFVAMTFDNSVAKAAVFNLTTGAVTNIGGSVTAATATSVGNGWWRLSMTVSGSVGFVQDYVTQTAGFPAETGNGVDGVYFWGAQLETGSTATTYQRTGATSGVAWPAPPSYDITEAGQPDLHYLHYNGVSSFMVSPTITPGIDKAQVFVGVRKFSDAADGTILHHGDPTALNNGSLRLDAPGSGGVTKFQFAARGTTTATPFTTNSVFNAPTTKVVSGIDDISGDNATLRIGGALVSLITTDQGTGNFLAYPIYTGRRGGATNPFNGLVYSKIVRFGANLTADTIASTERWTGQRTGVSL